MSGSYCERCGRLLRLIGWRERDGSATYEWVHICTNPDDGWIGPPLFDSMTGRANVDA